MEENDDLKPGPSFSPHQPITAGVVEDVRAIIKRTCDLFDENEELRFQYFIDTWKEMKFCQIFFGRETFKELYEFTEDLLAIIKDHVIADMAEFPHKVAALYLLYAVYFKQPVVPKVPIRLSVVSYTKFSNLMAKAREDSHLEMVFIWAKLVRAHAFHYCATETTLGIELSFALGQTKNSAQYQDDDTESAFLESVKLNLESVDILHKKYLAMKTALTGGKRHDPGLNLANPNFVSTMSDLIEEATNPGEKIKKDDSDGIGLRRKQLRDAALNNALSSTKGKKTLKSSPFGKPSSSKRKQ